MPDHARLVEAWSFRVNTYRQSYVAKRVSAGSILHRRRHVTLGKQNFIFFCFNSGLSSIH